MTQVETGVSIDNTKSKLDTAVLAQTNQEFFAAARALENSKIAASFPNTFWKDLSPQFQEAFRKEMSQYDAQIRSEAQRAVQEKAGIEKKAKDNAETNLSEALMPIRERFKTLKAEVEKIEFQRQVIEQNKEKLELIGKYHEAYQAAKTPEARAALSTIPPFSTEVAGAYESLKVLLDNLPPEIRKDVDDFRRQYEENKKGVKMTVGIQSSDAEQGPDWWHKTTGKTLLTIAGIVVAGFAFLHSAFQKDWGKVAGFGAITYAFLKFFNEGNKNGYDIENKVADHSRAENIASLIMKNGEDGPQMSVFKQVNLDMMRKYFDPRPKEKEVMAFARKDASGEKLKQEKPTWANLFAQGVVTSKENPFQSLPNVSDEQADEMAGKFVQWMYNEHIWTNGTRESHLLAARGIVSDKTTKLAQKQQKEAINA